MGTSTDAILFYGYCGWGEDEKPWLTCSEDDDDERDDDWEVQYAQAMGILPPTTPYPERQVKPTRENGWDSTPKDYTPQEQAIIDLHRSYWAKKREAVDVSGVEIDYHCLDECPMPFVAIKASVVRTYRGDMKEVKSVEVDPAWNDMLADFCRLMNIDVSNKKPAWWLVSWWS